jgi:aspartyl protease
LSAVGERAIFDSRPGVAELADALDSKSSARPLIKPAHPYSRLFRLYQEGRLPSFQRCASLLILAHREVIDKLKKKAGCIALGFLLLFHPALAQEHRTYTVPFRVVHGLILLDRQVNGKPATLLLDTGANNSVVDYRAAGLDALKLDALRSTGSTGAEGACTVWEVKLSLEHRSWFGRRVCMMNLADASKRIGVQIDGFIGTDVLSEFPAVRIDYKARVLELEE